MARRNILVPIDFSPASRHALKHALSLVGQEAGGITLLHVIPAAASATNRESEAEAKIRIRHLISEEAGGTDHSIRIQIQTGTPFQEILAAAQELSAGMIILGANESSRFGPISLGHTAERVLRYASCPVLLVRPGKAAQTLPSPKSRSDG